MTSARISWTLPPEELFDAAYIPSLWRVQHTTLSWLVRAVIEHNLLYDGSKRLWYSGPLFRHERPQKGRYRQFYQIDAEVIGPASAGSESPARDAEILEMLATLLDRLGISGWNLELNSVGCKEDPAKFNAALRQALEPVAAKMCTDCQRRAVTNPLRVLDCKVPDDQPIIDALPSILDHLCEECTAHFSTVRAHLDARGIAYEVRPRMVRGLDYYTRTTFEFVYDEPGEGGTKIVPRRENEFLCKSCFLVLPRHQLADEKRMICRDCA